MALTLKDILTDPSYAGLYWTIPRDTPPEYREQAHINAALVAKRTRDVKYYHSYIKSHDLSPINMQCSRCGKTAVEIYNNKVRCGTE